MTIVNASTYDVKSIENGEQYNVRTKYNKYMRNELPIYSQNRNHKRSLILIHFIGDRIISCCMMRRVTYMLYVDVRFSVHRWASSRRSTTSDCFTAAVR